MTLKQIEEAIALCCEQLVISGNQLAFAELRQDRESLIIAVLGFSAISQTVLEMNNNLFTLYATGEKVEETSKDIIFLCSMMSDYGDRAHRLFKVLGINGNMLN